MTYLTCRNEHIWPPTKVFTFDWKLFIWLSFFIRLINTTQIFEKRCHENFDISLTNKPFGFGTIHFNTFLLHLFLIKLVFEAMAFLAHFLFRDWHLKSSLKNKNKIKNCEEIYRHKFTHISRSNKTIDQSFMTSLKIYLQQSNIDF